MDVSGRVAAENHGGWTTSRPINMEKALRANDRLGASGVAMWTGLGQVTHFAQVGAGSCIMAPRDLGVTWPGVDHGERRELDRTELPILPMGVRSAST